MIFLHILCNKSIRRYFKHPLLDKTNNNIHFFSHNFLVQQIWTPTTLPPLLSMIISKYFLLPCYNIWLEPCQSTSEGGHRDWKWRMTPREEVSICSLHASRGSVQDNHVMYHSYCCNAAAAALIFSVAAVCEWEYSKHSPSSCSPHHSTHSALLQSVTQRNALQHTYTCTLNAIQ